VTLNGADPLPFLPDRALDAELVADRWHLMENSSRAFLDAVGKSMRQIRQAVGSNVVDPKLLTYAEKLQYEGYLRWQEANQAVRELSKKGTSIRQIVRQTGHSRKLVRDVLRGQRLDVFRTRPALWIAGCPGSTAAGRKGHGTLRHSGVR
jgi:transposase